MVIGIDRSRESDLQRRRGRADCPSNERCARSGIGGHRPWLRLGRRAAGRRTGGRRRWKPACTRPACPTNPKMDVSAHPIIPAGIVVQRAPMRAGAGEGSLAYVRKTNVFRDARRACAPSANGESGWRLVGPFRALLGRKRTKGKTGVGSLTIELVEDGRLPCRSTVFRNLPVRSVPSLRRRIARCP